jgi:hypothetical protein
MPTTARAFLAGSCLLTTAGLGPACQNAKDGTDTGEVAAITTSLDPTWVQAGQATTVSCAVTGVAEELAPVTTFTVEPLVLALTAGNQLIVSVAGTYRVKCQAPDLGLADGTGAELVVDAATPAKVTALLSKNPVAVFEPSQVACKVEGAEGTVVDVPTTVTAQEGALVDDHAVSAEKPGTYQVDCAVTGHLEVTSVPAQLEVTASPPFSVTLTATPDSAVYETDSTIQLAWAVADEYGNAISNLPATLSTPTEGVVVFNLDEHRYTLAAEGVHTFTVTLDAPYTSVTDSLDVIVDVTGPVITVTEPERGATILGTGEPVAVKGTVTDAVGEVVALKVAGTQVEVAPDGSFSGTIVPAWGVNAVKLEAADSHGLVSKLTPSFHYSSAYTAIGEEDTACSGQIPAGILALLGQTFLDDNDHDDAHINDFATLLEVILSNIDIKTLTGQGLGTTLTVLDPPKLDLGIVEGKLTGTLDLQVEILPQSDLGPTGVTLDTRPGGVDASITLGDGVEKGIVLYLHVTGAFNLSLDYKALGLSGSIALTPGIFLDTGFSAQVIEVTVSLDIFKGEDTELQVKAKDFDVTLTGTQLDPIDDVGVSFSFDILGTTQSFTLQLSQLIDPSLIWDALFGPIEQQVTQFLVDAIEPLIEIFAGDVIKSVLESFAFDTVIDLPNFAEAFAGGTQPPAAGDPAEPSPPDPAPTPEEVDQLHFCAGLSAVSFDDPGGSLGLGVGAWSKKGVERNPLGAIDREGCLLGLPGALEYDWAHPLGIGFKTDMVNHILFGTWWTGALDFPLDVGKLLGPASPIPLDDFHLDLHWLLPPIMNDCDKTGGIVGQIGDLDAHVYGSFFGNPLDVMAYLDVSVQLFFETCETAAGDTCEKGDGLYVKIGEMLSFDVEVYDVIVAGDDYFDPEKLLEDELPDLLGSFLNGKSIGPIPPMSFDLSSLVPGLAPGTSMTLGNLELGKQSGYLLLEGDML